MKLSLEKCLIRELNIDDAPSLAYHANNRKIWINLRDAFPHPYTEKDAKIFIKHIQEQEYPSAFTIEVNGAAVGCIGYGLKSDVERISAEIGYWIGEDYWNQGIVTSALIAVTNYAIKKHKLTRVFALPFGWNETSFRVLEKAGYKLEARLRRCVIKDGRIIDQLQYAYIVDE